MENAACIRGAGLQSTAWEGNGGAGIWQRRHIPAGMGSPPGSEGKAAKQRQGQVDVACRICGVVI